MFRIIIKNSCGCVVYTSDSYDENTTIKSVMNEVVDYLEIGDRIEIIDD